MAYLLQVGCRLILYAYTHTYWCVALVEVHYSFLEQSLSRDTVRARTDL